MEAGKQSRARSGDGPITRRRCLKRIGRCAAAGASLAIVPRSVLGGPGRAAPSERVTVGVIGTGSHGTGNLQAFLHQPDAQVVAVCDVHQGRVRNALNVVKGRYGRDFTGCQATRDWREVVAREDVDAVYIGTPDHWHVPISLAAARAGKDVCCEKPTLTVREGRVLSDTIARYGRVFQMSTEDRSIHVYHRMAELVRNGRIGELRTIRVKLPTGKTSPGSPPPEPVPEGLDYDMWLGPAPWAPYSRYRCGTDDWREISDYSGGQLTDWGAHLIDTAQWANDTERTGPVEVSGRGVFPPDGIYDAARQYNIEYAYASGVGMLVEDGGVALRFEGTEGWVGNRGWRGRLEASSKAILDSVIGPNETRLFTCPAGEHRNFLDCVRSRKDPYFPAEVGHRCCTVMHIGNISMRLGRPLRWDPDEERFVNDEPANRMLARAMREPWSL